MAIVDDVYTLTRIGPVLVQAKALSLRLPDADSTVVGSAGKAWSVPQQTTASTVKPTALPLPPVLAAATWDKVQVDVESWQVKRGTLTASGGLAFKLSKKDKVFTATTSLGRLCVDDPGAGVSGCFAETGAQGLLVLRPMLSGSAEGLHLDQVGPVRALGGRFKVAPRASAAGAKQPVKVGQRPAEPLALDPTHTLVPAWLQKAHLAPVLVQLERIDIDQDGKLTHAGLTLDGHGVGQGAVWSLGVRAEGELLPRRSNAAADQRSWPLFWSVAGQDRGLGRAQRRGQNQARGPHARYGAGRAWFSSASADGQGWSASDGEGGRPAR